MKKMLLLTVLFLLVFSFMGCSKIKTGTYELYYNGEFIGQVNDLIDNGDMICVPNPSESNTWFEYACWNKENIEYIKVEED